MPHVIICYSLGSILPKLRIRFTRELYGYRDSSHHGKYEYDRPGLLSSLAYEKPLEAVLLLPSQYTEKVITHLKKYHASFVIKLIQE
ncbi:hypothetical protein J4410_03710 [Candidatus Woesearchaeota archaeon]|nr:hypothetical protein [Candidatus Woesearchaeota archaeon]